jgi:Na+/H+ antiporter NhaA
MRRQIIWMLGVGFACWLMWSKGGYHSTIEAVTVALYCTPLI